jgi:hypothetical protein
MCDLKGAEDIPTSDVRGHHRAVTVYFQWAYQQCYKHALLVN